MKARIHRKEDDSYNPRLHDLVLEVIGNQIRDNEPPEAKQTYLRLKAAGYSESKSKEKMAAVLVEHLYDVLHDDAPFDKEQYIKDLLAIS